MRQIMMKGLPVILPQLFLPPNITQRRQVCPLYKGYLPPHYFQMRPTYSDEEASILHSIILSYFRHPLCRDLYHQCKDVSVPQS